MGSCHFALKQPSRTTLKMHSSALRKLKAVSFAWATTTHIFFRFVYEHYITKSYSLSVDQRASRNPWDIIQKNASLMVYVGERAHSIYQMTSSSSKAFSWLRSDESCFWYMFHPNQACEVTYDLLTVKTQVSLAWVTSERLHPAWQQWQTIEMDFIF